MSAESPAKTSVGMPGSMATMPITAATMPSACG